jgi:hypothetical protein
MTAMLKVKARWHGFTGSPGYSNFFFREWSDGSWSPTNAEASAATDKIHKFFAGIASLFPASVNIQVENDVEIIEDTDGKLQNVLVSTSRANVQGSSTTATFAAAAGAVVTWQTAGVRNGRRVRGRTFLVPTTTAAFEANGSLAGAHINNIGVAANALLAPDPAAPDFGVYSRPSFKGATDGQFQIANGFRVPDMAAVLRSRRD